MKGFLYMGYSLSVVDFQAGVWFGVWSEGLERAFHAGLADVDQDVAAERRGTTLRPIRRRLLRRGGRARWY